MDSKLIKRRKKVSSNKNKKGGEEEEEILTTSKGNEELPQDGRSSFKVDYKRIVIRCLIIIVVIFTIHYSQKPEMETFASHNEEIIKRSKFHQCTKLYSTSVSKFNGCVPKMCGTVVSDETISLSEVQALSNIAMRGMTLSVPNAEVTTLDLYSGILSNGNFNYNIYSMGKQIISGEDLKVFRYIEDKIKEYIVNLYKLKSNTLYTTRPTFISQSTSSQSLELKNQPPESEEMRSGGLPHFVSVLSLTELSYDFKGGRHVFIDRDTKTNHTVEGRPGRLISFAMDSRSEHFTEPVTKGTKLEVVFSFTCNPKASLSSSIR